MKKLSMSDGKNIDVWVTPAKGKRLGAVVLIQEIFGLTEHIREQCQRWANEGFEVWAPAIFDRQAPGLNLSYSQKDIETAITLVKAHNFELAVSDAMTCIQLLAVEGLVFITGYCYGGSVSWACAARSEELSGAACYYGSKISSLKDEKPRCPTIVHFGEFDPEIPLESVRELQVQRPEVDIYLYPAGHGFQSDRRDDYHKESAELAWERTKKLFTDIKWIYLQSRK
ncbi:dienelactone hydrolase family protein [Erwinia typographi]|uniref:dienelactone hydrolase family protein n=1 Tax=Erwinia typographi TaxID=371042 RepID=UPI00068F4A80|nr:dienelactone hydrolase family protein [Erwinia typographi]